MNTTIPGKSLILESRLNSLQIFRGLAATVVLLYHISLQFSAFVPGAPDVEAAPWMWTVHRMGFLGVDFFFVLSGFIIYHIHRKDLGHGETSTRFFLKRLCRIQPLLWIIILIKQLYLTFGSGEDVAWMAVFNTMFCLPGHKIIGVAWTLTFEWLFYLFFIGCILAGRRWLWIGIVSWAVVVVALCHVDKTDRSHWLQVATSPYVIQFLSGVIAAECYRLMTTVSFRRCMPIICVAIALALAGILLEPFNLTPREWRHPVDMAFGRFYWGFVFGLVVWWLAIHDRFFRHRFLLPLVLIGNASYAIYLFHNEMLQAFIRIGQALEIFTYGSAVLWMWIFTSGILAACLMIHLMVETPILKWSRRFISRSKG